MERKDYRKERQNNKQGSGFGRKIKPDRTGVDKRNGKQKEEEKRSGGKAVRIRKSNILQEKWEMMRWQTNFIKK